jgi:hypothetical protein
LTLIQEEAVMGGRFGYQALLGLVMLAMLAGVGVYGYNLGVAHGVAIAASGTVPGGALPMAYWPRPWGFGFGFFPFFPFVILFWFFLVRGLFWRGRWGGRGYWHGGVPPAFDEWHRRAHAQQGPPSSAANV